MPLLVVLPAAADDQYHDKPTSEDIAQKLDWTACNKEESEQTGTLFECANLVVPLDYDDIDLDLIHEEGIDKVARWAKDAGLAIDLPLVRIPASDPNNRQGAILLNPGGPGGSGINLLLNIGPQLGFLFGLDVLAQFDLVGFDPRGIGQSAPIRCFDTTEEAQAVLPPFPFPLSVEEIRQDRDAVKALAKACRSYDGAREIGEHMSTANVARDMDVIRASMGDESLNFYGLSYGSYVAATYANLFPKRVRAFVADGVLDPEAWANRSGRVPFTSRLRSDEGAAETLEEFFVQCDAAIPGNCAFAPDSRNRFAALANRLRNDGPIEVELPDGGETVTVSYQVLISVSLSNLYNPFDFVDFAEALAFVESIAAEPATVAVSSPAFVALMEAEPYDNFVESPPAVACVDTNNPRSFRAYARAANIAEAKFGYFGPLWTWSFSSCIAWPFKDGDRYTGPFTATTASPVLVIGNFFDPATRYEGAQALRSLLPNSSLLSVDVPGHTSLGLSQCAADITAQYFLDPSNAAAVDGFVCPSDFGNFFDAVAGQPPDPEASAGAQADSVSDADMAVMIEMRTKMRSEVGPLAPFAR